MQIPAALAQSANGNVEGKPGPAASPARAGLPEESQFGSGFLSVLQGAQPPQASDSTTAEESTADTSDGSAQETVPQSLAIALTLAGAAILETTAPSQAHGSNAKQADTPMQQTGEDAAAASLPAGLQELTLSNQPSTGEAISSNQGVQSSPGQRPLIATDKAASLAVNITGENGARRIDAQSDEQPPHSPDTQPENSLPEAIPGPRKDGKIVVNGSAQAESILHPNEPTTQQDQGTPSVRTANQAEVTQGAVTVPDISKAADRTLPPVGTESEKIKPFDSPASKVPSATTEDGRMSGELSSTLSPFKSAVLQDDARAGARDGETFSSSKQELPSFTHSQSRETFGATILTVTGQNAPATGISSQAPAVSPNTNVQAPPPIPLQNVASHGSAVQSVTLELPQADLGQLRVRVVLADQTVHTHLMTERGDLGQMLVNRQEQLGTQLSTAGLELGQLRVQVDRQGHQQGGQEGLSHAYEDRGHPQRGQHQQQERPSDSPLRQPMRQTALSVFA